MHNLFFNTNFIINSLPKSGTNLVAKLLGLMPGGFRPVVHLGNHSYSNVNQAFAYTTTVRIGVDMPIEVPRRLVEKDVGRVSGRRFATAHVPYTRDLSDIFRQKNIKLLLVIRDPRSVVLSLVDYIDREDSHPLHQCFKKIGSDEKFAAVIEGRQFSDKLELVNLKDRLLSILQWKNYPNAKIVRFEDLVGERGGSSDKVMLDTVRELVRYLGIHVSGKRLEKAGARLFGGTKTFYSGSIERWKSGLPPEALEKIRVKLGGLMDNYGYKLD